MQTETIFKIEALLGGADHIVNLLDIHDASHEDQALLAERFADIVLKRLLLSVSDESLEDVKLAFSHEDLSPESFVQTLERSIPDFDATLHQAMDQTVTDLRGSLTA